MTELRTYKQFVLDDFQAQAIDALDAGDSVVVSAATGTGKTLIADYIIDKSIQKGTRVVYTAPIKALSNQKFREFKAAYGDHVGILTGDVVINPGAQILIMTTEIYRNMLLEQSADLENISHVIFDEIHYLNDIERGTVWEESIIFSPDSIRFLCLSATVPNYEQFASWISHIKHHKVQTVNYMKRAVPLNHLCYDVKFNLTTFDKVIRDIKDHDYPTYNGRYSRSQKKQRVQPPHHLDLITELQVRNYLPCIFFAFSRKLTESRAIELARKKTLTNPNERKEIVEYLAANIPETIRHMESTQLIKDLAAKGVGVHHAGLLPKLKELIEHLFDRGLLKVLYATETFAVGINMPAKAVCFAALEKYDGIGFRLLNSKEYFQLAGRAGRRGIDTVGYAISIVDRNDAQMLQKMEKLTQGDVEPIVSRYDLSYNTVLNLIKRHDEQKIKTILHSNFGSFVKKQQNTTSRVIQSYYNYQKNLEKLGFLENSKITWKGEFTSKIYIKELEVGELVYSEILTKLSPLNISILMAALTYEPRRGDEFEEKYPVDAIVNELEKNEFLSKHIKPQILMRVASITHAWFEGASFDQVLVMSNMSEGDIIRFFRQVIDLLRQIRGSLLSMDPRHALIPKLAESLRRIDRDLVSVEL